MTDSWEKTCSKLELIRLVNTVIDKKNEMTQKSSVYYYSLSLLIFIWSIFKNGVEGF